MSAGHRPKAHRSITGCCICGAKSSSSRFTSSLRYEQYFRRCFALAAGEQRFGDICNACVLLVKRFRKLPFNSTRSWGHMKDARIGPGVKSANRLKTFKLQSMNDQKSSPPIAAKRQLENDDSLQGESDSLSDCSGRSEDRMIPLDGTDNMIDFTYWKRLNVCCGIVYRGQYGEYLLDAKHYRPCAAHQQRSSSSCQQSNSIIDNIQVPVNNSAKPMPDLCNSFSVGNIERNVDEADKAIDLSVQNSSVIDTEMKQLCQIVSTNEV